MADRIFNIAKGRFVYYTSQVGVGNAGLVVMLLKAAETEADLVDRTDFSNLLGQAGNTEADFTNYARKILGAASVAVDNTNDRADTDFTDQTWTTAGGASNNSIVRAVVGFDPDTTGGTDGDIIPLSLHDFVVTTDGSDLTLQVNTAGFGRAQNAA